MTVNQAAASARGVDRFYPLVNGSFRFSGMLADAIAFIKREQLMDAELWKLFVNQFRRGDVDDENRGWRCEYWGKMMRGGCMVYACAPDEELFAVLTDTVEDMLTTQDAAGRFSTYSKAKELDGWDLWGRKYILLGMEHYLEICRDEGLAKRITSALIRHADAILATVGPADEGKKEILEASRHWKGLNSSSLLEPMVRLYNLTGEKRYLDFSEYIVSRGGTTAANLFELAYADELAPYQYPVTKAYEMMSNFEGLLEYYRVTGIEKYRVACVNLADQIAKTDITVIGCAGCTHELFDHSAVRQFDESEKGIMQETCVTVTWMKLCWQLLRLTGESRCADLIERSAYNALLGAVNTDKVTVNGGLPFDSYSPLLPGVRGRKIGGYMKMENDTYYGCCACIGAAGLGLTGIAQAARATEGIYINFYMPGVINTSTPQGGALTLTTQTEYPVCGDIHIRIAIEHDEEFAIGLRIPAWSKQTICQVNGQAYDCISGEYLRLSRVWRAGDEIDLCLDMRVMPMTPEDDGVSSGGAPFAALRRGPLVLARDERLGGPVEDTVALPMNADGSVETVPVINPPFPCAVCLDVPTRDGGGFRVCDYASAGKTWTEQSKMCAWLRVKEGAK